MLPGNPHSEGFAAFRPAFVSARAAGLKTAVHVGEVPTLLLMRLLALVLVLVLMPLALVLEISPFVSAPGVGRGGRGGHAGDTAVLTRPAGPRYLHGGGGMAGAAPLQGMCTCRSLVLPVLLLLSLSCCAPAPASRVCSVLPLSVASSCQVPVEVCPTSNVRTLRLASYEEHPTLLKLLQLRRASAADGGGTPFAIWYIHT